jgi:hypothetical protein
MDIKTWIKTGNFLTNVIMHSVPEGVKKCYISLSLDSFVSEPVATRGEEVSRYKLPEPVDPEGGPGPDYVACVFVFLGSIIICKL